MKSFIAFSTLLAAVTAAPSIPFLSGQICPANGILPPNTIDADFMIPVSRAKPDQIFDPSRVAQQTPKDMCTIWNLPVPDNVDGQPTQNMTCTLMLYFPNRFQAPFTTSKWNGPGHFSFTGFQIGAAANEQTTWNNQPPPGPSPQNPPKVVQPGNTYVVNQGLCQIPPGAGTVTVAGMLCSEDTTWVFEQSDRICPIGFFVVIS